MKDAMKVINTARAEDRDIAVLDLFNNTEHNISKIYHEVTNMGYEAVRESESVIVYL